MKTSSSIAKIAPALLAAQKLMGGAKKEARNPYFKSKYADLGAVLEACKELLNENNIIILQPHSESIVETILMHSSGEFVSSETKIVTAKENDPQAYGSAITYARRYGLQSLLSMPAEDDDAETSMNRTTKPAATKAAETTAKAETTANQTVTTTESKAPATTVAAPEKKPASFRTKGNGTAANANASKGGW